MKKIEIYSQSVQDTAGTFKLTFECDEIRTYEIRGDGRSRLYLKKDGEGIEIHLPVDALIVVTNDL